MNFFHFHSWKCTRHMLLLYNKDWFLLLHITYINFIWKNRGNSRFDQLSLKYTDQIRKQHRLIPLGFPHILLTTTTFFSFSSSVSVVFFLSFSLFFLRNKIWNIYIPIHNWLCGWISDKKIFTRLISGNKTTFFGLSIVLFSRFNHHKTVISTTNTWFLKWT